MVSFFILLALFLPSFSGKAVIFFGIFSCLVQGKEWLYSLVHPLIILISLIISTSCFCVGFILVYLQIICIVMEREISWSGWWSGIWGLKIQLVIDGRFCILTVVSQRATATLGDHSPFGQCCQELFLVASLNLVFFFFAKLGGCNLGC